MRKKKLNPVTLVYATFSSGNVLEYKYEWFPGDPETGTQRAVRHMLNSSKIIEFKIVKPVQTTQEEI